MKQQNLATIYIILISLSVICSTLIPKTATATNYPGQVIPEESIRLRILANSNSRADQDAKQAIRDQVKSNMDRWAQEANSIEKARVIIASHVDEIAAIANVELQNRGLDEVAQVTLDQSDFPTKLYGDYLYPAGKYEALVISIGEAEGDNWWCVLYPPLCFLDFSSNSAVDPKKAETSVEKDEQQEPEVDYAIKRFFQKLFN